MALITWSDKYSVHVRDIDTQHQELVRIINSLHDAMARGEAVEKLSSIFDALMQYTVTHFTAEERLMERTRYPTIMSHKLAHKEFVDHMQTLQAKFKNGKVAVTLEVMGYLKDWLIKHIGEMDVRVGAHLNQSGMK